MFDLDGMLLSTGSVPGLDQVWIEYCGMHATIDTVHIFLHPSAYIYTDSLLNNIMMYKYTLHE